MSARLTLVRVASLVGLGIGLMIGFIALASPVAGRAPLDPCGAMWLDGFGRLHATGLFDAVPMLLGYGLISAALLLVWRGRDRRLGMVAEHGDRGAYVIVIGLVEISMLLTMLFLGVSALALPTVGCAI